MNIGPYLRALRGKRSLASVADAMGLSSGFMSDVELGKRHLTPARASQLAKVLELSPVLEAEFLQKAFASRGTVSFDTESLSSLAVQTLAELHAAAPKLSDADWDHIRTYVEHLTVA